MSRMVRISFLCLAACLALLAVPGPAAAETKPVQIALFSPVQVFPPATDIVGVRVDLLYGRNHDMTGLDLGLVNHSTGSEFAWQWGGVGYVEHDFVGWQNNVVNLTNGTFTGFQDGLVNHVGSTTAAFQMGAVNHGNTVVGCQLGCVNYTESMNGLQVGLLNWTKQMHGLQIGIGNIIEKGKYPFLPIVNWTM
jgi:hypothetical protein